jgi:uncharacterized protein
MRFEWIPQKLDPVAENTKLASTKRSPYFRDPLARIVDDPDHSVDERREIAIGHSIMNRLLFVFFAERDKGTVRIITARQATRQERKDYEEKSKF